MDKNRKNDIITSDSKQGQLNFEENYLPHKINISYFVTLRCVSFWARLVCMLTPDSVSWRKRTVVVVVYDIDRDFVISRSAVPYLPGFRSLRSFSRITSLKMNYSIQALRYTNL